MNDRLTISWAAEDGCEPARAFKDGLTGWVVDIYQGVPNVTRIMVDSIEDVNGGLLIVGRKHSQDDKGKELLGERVEFFSDTISEIRIT